MSCWACLRWAPFRSSRPLWPIAPRSPLRLVAPLRPDPLVASRSCATDDVHANVAGRARSLRKERHRMKLRLALTVLLALLASATTVGARGSGFQGQVLEPPRPALDFTLTDQSN